MLIVLLVAVGTLAYLTVANVPDAAVATLGIVGAVAAMLRYGLLAVVWLGTVLSLILALPVTADLSAHYASTGLFGVAVTMGVAVLGYRLATAPSRQRAANDPDVGRRPTSRG